MASKKVHTAVLRRQVRWASAPVGRRRQHVNPLAAKFQRPLLPKLNDAGIGFRKVLAPLHLDLGSNTGEWVEQLSKENRATNFIGVEIRPALVVAALARTESLRSSDCNLCYIEASINAAAEELLEDVSKARAPLRCVSIMHPDPWFKRRHIKRRMFTPELIRACAEHLESGGAFLFQSDVRETFNAMLELVESTDALVRDEAVRVDDSQGGFFRATNGAYIRTERETSTLRKGGAIYRARFVKQ